MLNARTLRSAQLLILDKLEKLSVTLLNVTRGDELKISHQMNESAEELMAEMNAAHHLETQVYGYV